MMNLQYITDKSGHTTAVQLQITVEDWDQLKKKYKEFDEVERDSSSEISDWQIKLGKAELKNIANGKAGLMDWNEAKKEFKT